MELEKDIENYLKTKVERQGYICLKFVSPGTKGVPDRIVITRRRTFYIELKKPGGKLSPSQIKWIDRLRIMKRRVFVISSKEEVDNFIMNELWR